MTLHRRIVTLEAKPASYFNISIFASSRKGWVEFKTLPLQSMHSLSDCNIRQHKPCQSCQDQRMVDIKENGSANKRLAPYSVLTLCLGKSVSQLAESKKVKEHLEKECRGVWLLIKSYSCIATGHQDWHMVLTYLVFFQSKFMMVLSG